MVNLVRRDDGLRNLRSVSCIQDHAGEGFEKKAAVVTFQEGFCEPSFARPGSARIYFFAQHVAAALALAVHLVEGLHLGGFGRELVLVPFDCFEVKLGV